MNNNFWDGFSQNKNLNNNGFNLQGFFKFANEMKGKDPNQVLNQMISSGQVTQQQIQDAKSQAEGIYQMLQTMGIKL